MKISVSTRRSATLPTITRRNDSVGLGPKRSSQSGRGIGISRQVGVERPANDLCHRHALRGGQGVDAAALLVSEVNLSSGRWHTARVYSMQRGSRRPGQTRGPCFNFVAVNMLNMLRATKLGVCGVS